MLERLLVIFRETLEKWSCELIEFKGEADHVHLLIRTSPTVQLSKLINNLKIMSSRLIRRDFGGYLSWTYRKPIFWHRSYCLISSGGATTKKLRKYSKSRVASSASHLHQSLTRLWVEYSRRGRIN
jgi:putative transposase